MKQIMIWILLSVSAIQLKAQDADKISIAVLPFINAANVQGNYAGITQEMVTKEFVKGNRFVILDRSKFQKVLEELNVQKTEEFLNSKIVEQGRLAGAQYIITGVLNQMESRKESESYYDPTSKTTRNIENWRSEVRLSFQVIDVATSRALIVENLSGTNSTSHSMSSNDAMDNAMCRLNKALKGAVRKLFPEQLEILAVEKSTKKGLPEVVIISAGTSYFDSDYKKGDECEKGVLDALNKINPFKKKDVIRLKVYEMEVMNSNGKEIKREKEIGKLKLQKVEGDVSLCEVSEGEKEIQQRLNDKKKLLVKIL